MSRRISLLLHDDFFKTSLNSQIRGMCLVSQFVGELLNETRAKTKLIVRYGSQGKKNVSLTEEGILELPMQFSLQDVKSAVSSKQ